MRKEDYLKILKEEMLPSGLSLIVRGFTFQEDNDPKYSSKLCREFLGLKEKQKVLKRMIWPPQSPDLNPIELFCDQSDRKIRKRVINSQEELCNCLKTEWSNSGTEKNTKLIDRMPRICSALIKNKGRFFDESSI